MTKSTKQPKIETAEDYLKAFEAIKDEILEPGEIAKQMVKHNPMYFVTNRARVFSIKSNGRVKFLKQHHRGHKDNNRAGLSLSILGKREGNYVHKLVAKYFPLKSYLTGKGKEIIHHIKTYNMNTPQESNKPENLEIIDNHSLHKTMHVLPFTTESEERFLTNAEKLSKLTNPNYDVSIVEISPDGNERSITAMTYDELLNYLRNGEIVIQHVAFEPIENEEKGGDAIDA